jgi:hypothetical protein
MMHAVDQRTLEDFLPNLGPLDSEQQKILDDNYDHFHRGAVHLLSEQLKNAESYRVKPWAKHILYRYEQFQKMMSATEKPKEGEDPVSVYGRNREPTGTAR